MSVLGAATIALIGASQAGAVTQHLGKTISVLEVAMSDCYFFQLAGVYEADPSVPNSPWFAIHKTQANAKEMYALLLSLRSTGGMLSRVATTSDVVCGHAQVATLDF
jgi:hypothetical protein